MTIHYLLTALLTLFLFGCDNNIDKSLINQAAKLKSPFSAFTLYRYHIESSMPFGAGFTVVNILPSDENCDFTDRGVLRFDNNFPFYIKWKNKDSLTVKCLLDGEGLADKQPIRKEIQKWKEWTFEVEYYSLHSTFAEVRYSIDSYSTDKKFITFSSKDNTHSFSKDEVQLSVDTNHVYITKFKIDTFKSKQGISLSHYDMNIPEKFTKSLNELQPFVRTNPD